MGSLAKCYGEFYRIVSGSLEDAVGFGWVVQEGLRPVLGEGVDSVYNPGVRVEAHRAGACEVEEHEYLPELDPGEASLGEFGDGGGVGIGRPKPGEGFDERAPGRITAAYRTP